MRISQNSVLSDLTLPRLTYIRSLDVRHNPRLLNFTANVARRVDRVHLEGNFTNVELFSLEEVTGDFRVLGAPSMDCSWFDQNFFQKVVKGSYQCVGNHTTPDVPRRPSTATDLEDLGDDGGGAGGRNNGTVGVDTSEGGLSTGARAGIGVGAALGAIGALALGGLFWWKRKRGGTGGVTGDQTLGHDKSELDAAAAVVKKGQDDGYGEGKCEDTVLDSQPELDSTSFKGVEADSKVAVPGVELDPSPRDQAGTREELDGSAARSELPSGGKRMAAELPGY